MFVCICCVLYRNPNRWTGPDEIWHGGGPRLGKVLGGGGLTWYPNLLGMGCVKGVQGASGASTMCFGENFLKQKLLGTPDLVRAGHLLGLKSGSRRTWALCPGAIVTHHEGEFIKSKLHFMLIIGQVGHPIPWPCGPGGPKGGTVLEPQGCILAKTL